jgi:hypothetical protein
VAADPIEEGNGRHTRRALVDNGSDKSHLGSFRICLEDTEASDGQHESPVKLV